MSDDVISGLQHGTCTPDRYNYSSDNYHDDVIARHVI